METEHDQKMSEDIAPRRAAFDELIEKVLALVDSKHWPSAWGRDVSVGEIADHVLLFDAVTAVFGDPRREKYLEVLDGMLKDASRFCLRAPKGARLKIRDEIESAFIDYGLSEEVLPLLFGIAFGLRIGGLTGDQAKSVLAGFFAVIATTTSTQ